MNKTYTTNTAPARLAELGRLNGSGEPLKPVTVRMLARKHSIGTKVGRDWLFTEANIQAMADLPRAGRPGPKEQAAGISHNNLKVTPNT